MSRTDSTMGRSNSSSRALGLLVLGAALGLAVAAAGLLRSGVRSDAALPAEVIARVNHVNLLSADYERLIAGVESDTRAAADAAMRRRVLDRMIDEELLVQRGLEIGLARWDRKVRGDLTSAVIQSVVVEAEDREPTRAELERFFDEHRNYYVQPGRTRVEQIFFRVRSQPEEASALARATDAVARLARGETFEAVRLVGDPVISPIPDALLPAAKLREYIGPAALEVALELPVGVPSQPVRSGVGYHVLQVMEREAAHTPEFDAIESAIRAEWRRRIGDDALRDYLLELRSRADIAMRPPTQP